MYGGGGPGGKGGGGPGGKGGGGPGGKGGPGGPGGPGGGGPGGPGGPGNEQSKDAAAVDTREWWEKDCDEIASDKPTYDDMLAKSNDGTWTEINECSKTSALKAFQENDVASLPEGACKGPGCEKSKWASCNDEGTLCPYAESVPDLDASTGKYETTDVKMVSRAVFMNTAEPIYVLSLAKSVSEAQKSALLDLYAHLSGANSDLFPEFASSRNRINVLRQSTLDEWKSASDAAENSAFPTTYSESVLKGKGYDAALPFLYDLENTEKEEKPQFFHIEQLESLRNTLDGIYNAPNILLDLRIDGGLLYLSDTDALVKSYLGGNKNVISSVEDLKNLWQRKNLAMDQTSQQNLFRGSLSLAPPAGRSGSWKGDGSVTIIQTGAEVNTIVITLAVTATITVLFFLAIYGAARKMGQQKALALMYKLIKSSILTFAGMLFELSDVVTDIACCYNILQSDARKDFHVPYLTLTCLSVLIAFPALTIHLKTIYKTWEVSSRNFHSKDSDDPEDLFALEDLIVKERIQTELTEKQRNLPPEIVKVTDSKSNDVFNPGTTDQDFTRC